MLHRNHTSSFGLVCISVQLVLMTSKSLGSGSTLLIKLTLLAFLFISYRED